jgi:4-methylaminobutanoate oxidase (formaldehyde-forming)
MVLSSAKTVIIGGGAIGLSVAYHLGLRGAENVVLLERNRLTSGTSWHAAGICGPLRSSYNLTLLARYGVELFGRLEAETGQATGYRQTGGMWLAQNAARMTELRRMKALGDMHGLGARLVTPEQAGERFSLLNPDGLAGALWVDEDGQLNPVDLCMAYARGARKAGVTIREQAGVASMERRGGRIAAVILDDGERIRTDKVINCAGLWAGLVGSLVNAEAPLRAVEHMYVVSEPVDGLPDPCPIVRDLDSGIYIKGDAGKLVLGQFEPDARLWNPSDNDPGADFLEFADDWEQVEPMLGAGIRRVPAFGQLGISRFMNGPESFTADTRQLMGRLPSFENFYVAAGFNSIGIMSSAGVGRVMADWMLDGRPPMDLWDVDIQRMLPWDGDTEFLAARIPEAVHNQFQLHWPYKQYRTGRDRKRSPWHGQLAEQGAVFGAPTGWERPLWFACDDNERGFEYSYGAQCWWPAAVREAKRLENHGALFELSPFTKIDIAGPEAGAALQRLCSNDIRRPPGSVVYTLMLNEQGGIEADGTVIRLDECRWWLVTGAATRVRDIDRLRRLLPTSVSVRDVTEEEAVLGVMGPRSRRLMGDVLDSPCLLENFPFATMKPAAIGGVSVRLARISYVGEFGYEVYIPRESACEVLAAIARNATRLEIGFAGHFCLDACRLEKDFVHWGHDIGPDDDPLSAGLMHAVRIDGGFDFIGRDAVLRLSERPPAATRRLFEVHGEMPLLLHDEPLFRGEELVGRTTSGGIGFRTGKALCMGYVRGPVDPSAEWWIDVAGERLPMTPLEKPPYDPEGRRMRT